MHHKTKEAAVKKYSHHESIVVLIQAIKADNVDLSDEEVNEIVETILNARQKPKEEIKQSRPLVEMNRYDMWKGDLVMIKDRPIPGTGQRQIIEMQFQFTDPKPKKSVTVTQKQYEFWNETHFTARRQSTEMLFPAGQKNDMRFKYNDDTEKWDIIIHELETA